MKIIEICRDHPITEGSILDGKILGYQLIFTHEMRERLQEIIDHPEWKIRWVPVAKPTWGGEEKAVKDFEKKYGVKCVWQDVDDGKGNSWKAYKIIEKN